MRTVRIDKIKFWYYGNLSDLYLTMCDISARLKRRVWAQEIGHNKGNGFIITTYKPKKFEFTEIIGYAQWGHFYKQCT